MRISTEPMLELFGVPRVENEDFAGFPVRFISGDALSDLAPPQGLGIAAHPWLGVLALFQFRREQEQLSYRAMTVAYEHHMKCDLSGYPKTLRPRQLSMTSKIVAVAVEKLPPI